ncbi:hypothetical protein MU1_42760 [Paenibacillus glycanilyticus]|uniref:Tetratricopeptide repeat protein n=2 Tax=Paenibacillus glycanilyticus TaxID=126569 RepID=A0ABQ6GHE9_9BACL|nr:hypothetical protein MU1_42760 [Paenibacillus glycanilyticus]
MPDGKQKLAVLEEMIRVADRYMTEEEAYQARMDYSNAAPECGCPERMLVSFSWCLKKFEDNPGNYSNFYIMWHYKWVLGYVWRLPELSLEQIERVFEDFKEKCHTYGYSLRVYYQKRLNFMLWQGKMAEAAECYKSWRAAKRDSLSDCSACEQNMFGSYHFAIGHHKKGLQSLRPILEGKMSCRSVPQNTYSEMMLPLLKLGEYDRATETAKKAYRFIKGPSYLEEYGTFLQFFTVTDMPKAVKLYEQTVGLGLGSKLGWDRLQYFVSVRIFLKEWSRTRRRKKLAESELVTLGWLDQEISRLVQAFNRRNGNSFVEEWIREKEKVAARLQSAYGTA